MAAAMTGFPSKNLFDLVYTMLYRLDSSRPGNIVHDSQLLPYPLYWTLSVNRWYMTTGDARFSRLVSDVQHILNSTLKTFGTKPPLIFMGWDDRLGAGFCGSSCPLEAQLVYASLAVKAVQEFARSLQHSGNAKLAELYANHALEMTRRIRQWPSFFKAYGAHAAGNAIWANVARGEEVEMLRKQALNDRVTICSWSAFNQYFLLEAMGQTSQGRDRAIEMIHLCWEPMLDLSKGCFWELFSPEWVKFMREGDKPPTRPSLCHPWSSGVTPWLTENILGIRPKTPGFAQYITFPHVSRNHPHVHGHLYTPRGKIQLSASLLPDTVHGGPTFRVTLTNPSTAFVVFPVSWEAEESYKFVKAIDELSDSLLMEHKEEEMDGQRVAVLGPIQRREVSILAVYSRNCRLEQATKQKTMSYTFLPPAVYRTNGSINRTIRGNWRTAGIGKTGFKLFAYNGGADVEEIPVNGPIHAIRTFRSTGSRRRKFLGKSAKNPTFLQDPKGGNARSLGYVSDGGDGSQGIVVDLVMEKGVKFTAMVYMVAPSNATKQAIRVVDGEDFGVIAPTPLVDSFEQGLYYTIDYNNSIRFRIMNMEGDNTVSAVFVDVHGSSDTGRALPLRAREDALAYS